MCRKAGLLFLLISIVFCFGAAASAQQQPIPIEFEKAGGGQWIYCNNPEFVRAKDLSTIENPEATYLLKNEALGPDKYSVFNCFYNWNEFDIEADIEFVAREDSIITIQSAGFRLPVGFEYWDCIGTWSDYMGINIKTLNHYQQHVPYQGDTGLPRTITLKKGERDWVGKYIYNYDVVRPRMTFNMLVDFTIESGSVDVNFAALKNYGTLNDRSYHNPEAAPGKYYNDTSVKGIETESLPRVEAELEIVIDADTPNGENMPVLIHNRFFNDGNVVPYWMTNINIVRDDYRFSKEIAVDTDMLTLAYRDDSKLSYYGPNVPAEKRDNVWLFDPFHHNTLGYESGMPWDAATHVPNAPNGNSFDIDNPPDQKWEFNLGNFGVTNRYYLTVSNIDSKKRTLNYVLDTSLTSSIVIVRDEYGQMLNPYTHTRTDPFALCKGINSNKKEDCMFSTELYPGQTKSYILDVILPTNCYGGIVNILRADEHKYLQDPGATPYPSYTSLYEYGNCFYNGEAYMKWENGTLQRRSGTHWSPVRLPGGTSVFFQNRTRDFSFVKLKNGYAGRFSGWDGLGWNVSHSEDENKVYFFDENMNLLRSKEFGAYVENMYCVDGVLYVDAEKEYQSSDYITFTPLEDGASLAAPNRTSMFLWKGGQLYERNGTNGDTQLYYESRKPHELFAAGELLYYRKSWKSYYTDPATPNVLSVSTDGIYWTDFTLPDCFYELMDVVYLEGKIYIDCRYQTFVFDYTPNPDYVRVKLGSRYLGFDTPAKTVNDRTMVPLRFFFESLGAAVGWDEETQTVTVTQGKNTVVLQIGSKTAYVNGAETLLDVPAYSEQDRTMIPTRFLAESLGYTVSWDEKSRTASISEKPAQPSTPAPAAMPTPFKTPPAVPDTVRGTEAQ